MVFSRTVFQAAESGRCSGSWDFMINVRLSNTKMEIRQAFLRKPLDKKLIVGHPSVKNETYPPILDPFKADQRANAPK